MNKRFGIVLAFAFIFSLAASVVIYRLVSARVTSSARTPEKRILVAARDLGVGTLVKDADVDFADWSGPVPASAIMTKEAARDRGVVANIYAGEPILGTRLAPKGAGAGLAATIPVGMRAVAVRVNEVVGVSGFAVPGMRVDVLILGNPATGGGGNAGTMSKTLLQNIEVLSAGQQIQKDAEGKPVSVQVVNLLVNPEQAEVLSLASNDARIQLVLRNPLDNKEIKTAGTLLTRLFGQVPPGAPPAGRAAAPLARRKVAPKVPEPKPVIVPVVVEVYHSGRGGIKRDELKFKTTDPAGTQTRSEDR